MPSVSSALANSSQQSAVCPCSLYQAVSLFLSLSKQRTARNMLHLYARLLIPIETLSDGPLFAVSYGSRHTKYSFLLLHPITIGHLR